MAYYRVCARCGANLDPGEHCDCMGMGDRRARPDVPEAQEEPGTGQLRFTWAAATGEGGSKALRGRVGA